MIIKLIKRFLIDIIVLVIIILLISYCGYRLNVWGVKRMNSKKAKNLRKVLGYDMKKEREDGRKYFNQVHKTLKDEQGNGLVCGIICDKTRRAYQVAKKFM